MNEDGLGTEYLCTCTSSSNNLPIPSIPSNSRTCPFKPCLSHYSTPTIISYLYYTINTHSLFFGGLDPFLNWISLLRETPTWFDLLFQKCQTKKQR